MGDLLIVGAGGHGRVVAEAAELMGQWENIMFLDDRTDVDRVLNHKIIGKLNDYEKFTKKCENVIVCIGDNQKRLDLIEKILNIGYEIPVIIHPKASVSKYSAIGQGSVILAGAVVNTGASIGKGCIININSCVDHDSTLQDGVHIVSSAIVRSMVKIGRLSTIRAGACVKAGTVLGDKTVICQGEVV